MRKVAALLIVTLVLAGCTAAPAPVMPRPADDVLKTFDSDTALAYNRFGFELYRELLEDGDNLLISPVSVAMALAMAYNGTDGETREAMAQALKVRGWDLETLNRNNLALLYFLRTADEKVTLNIANSLWMRQGFPFGQEFLDRVQEYYLAAARELDFNDPKAADAINGWVKEKTGGLIPRILEGPISPLTIMYLINAVYFQGEWTKKFDEKMTRDEAFKGAVGKEILVPMMYQTGRYEYYRDPGFEAIRLPYGEEERMAMYVFLPGEGSSLEDFHKTLKAESFEGWLAGFTEGEGTILMPRFTLEYEKSLNDALKTLGMEVAFDPGRADFTQMVPADIRDDVHISEVKHKTYIEVDEGGTKAAAVTSVEVSVTSMPVYDFQMKVNRPFFYVLHDRETGALLFMGSVSHLE